VPGSSAKVPISSALAREPSATSADCPRASMARPQAGDPAAVPTAKAPATMPAAVNEPRSARTSRTSPIGTMVTGRRATSDSRSAGAAPG
jgi:hypothetical protein